MGADIAEKDGSRHRGRVRDRERAAIPEPAARAFDAYDPVRERPLAAHAMLVAAFQLLAGAGYVALRRRGRVPESPSLREAARIGVATHKLARLIAKDKVTSFIRSPFTRFRSSREAGPGEVEEEPRGTDLRYAVGELLGCPHCLAPWIATALFLASGVAPREARLVTSVLEAVTVSDFMQIAYKGAEERLL